MGLHQVLGMLLRLCVGCQIWFSWQPDSPDTILDFRFWILDSEAIFSGMFQSLRFCKSNEKICCFATTSYEHRKQRKKRLC